MGLILSVFTFDVRRRGGDEIVAVVGVEAVSRAIAEAIAKLIAYDRTGVGTAEQELTDRVLIAGLHLPAGKTRRERDRIKRRAKRERNRIERMPPEERPAVLAAALRTDVPGRAAVIVHAGPSAGIPASPAPRPLIPIKPRAVISDGATAMAGYAASGSFDTYLSRAGTAGLILRESGAVKLLDAGDAVTPIIDSPGSLGRLHATILATLDGPSTKIIKALIAAWQPGCEGISVADLAAASGYAASGSFDTYLSRLGTRELIERKKGLVKPTEVLFPPSLM